MNLMSLNNIWPTFVLDKISQHWSCLNGSLSYLNKFLTWYIEQLEVQALTSEIYAEISPIRSKGITGLIFVFFP